MVHSSLISIVFRLINFAVLIGFAYYLFKKYFKNRIDEKIAQKEALLKGLEEQGYFLEAKTIHLENQRIEQEKRAGQMRQKIDDWCLAVAAQNNKKQEELRASAARVAERVAAINTLLQYDVWRKNVLPVAIKDAKQKLTQEFSEHERADTYIHHILHHLKKV